MCSQIEPERTKTHKKAFSFWSSVSQESGAEHENSDPSSFLPRDFWKHCG